MMSLFFGRCAFRGCMAGFGMFCSSSFMTFTFSFGTMCFVMCGRRFVCFAVCTMTGSRSGMFGRRTMTTTMSIVTAHCFYKINPSDYQTYKDQYGPECCGAGYVRFFGLYCVRHSF